ncbi:restriction endonuclease [Riemerella anatipestifer]|uniref:Restriction endonuclease n=2 Tax=Riemerella anatipestifer TaxID=34085 RepID=E4T9F7_RIEAD|nr:restriction endonuclease [Riemerella anatipestifer]ADQ81638.1 restriction endonuclease [Riemerella anatipestifer ATCC 11845 = DSM 15868]AFD55651.1 restriction endonuclease [Riemerella anatipestifer ATCC 11845 = DSM 15868]MBT0549493.1 restriction endonuclease [Riemerella anatipestifer]MBT0556227.1 restriction endonuclease [Riemerella anatipestifer]MBT0560256.1 restriction endonuclease [Riemerella anatipestifer]
MSIPKYNEIQVPALKLLEDGKILKLRDFIEPIALHFNLSNDEINQMYPSGNGYIFYDRISWALSYLNMAGLLDKPRRGLFKISQKGIELLKTPEKIVRFVEKEVQKSDKVKKEREPSKIEIIDTKSENLTPQEKLYNSFNKIRQTVYDEIINTILSKSPTAFEKLVVLLLQKMGYGGEIKDSGLVTKRTNDGGIDGIIKEDILGFGRINIQAKRYRRDIGIGREEIQKFVGALMVAQSNKGVFITTSYFSNGAREYVENLFGNTTIVLIDGNQLAEYIYNYGLGMQVEQLIEIKKMDSDFWDSMSDE